MKEFRKKNVQVCNASHFQKLWFVRFPAFGTISGQHLECVQRDLLRCFIQISLFKHFPMVYFGLKNQILAWTNDARMPGLFLQEIATKAGIQHPAQKLHFETVFERNPTQKGLASKP